MSDQKMFSAREESIHQIFNEKRYVIPYYQRPYSWLKNNAESLWEDLYSTWIQEGTGGSGYFLGSVVLVHDKVLGRDEIVDGQQRFITLQLLLSAIAHKLSDPDLARKLTRYFISEEDEFAGTKAELVVLPGNRYKDFYERILNKKELGEFSSSAGKRFIENYQLFAEKCEGLNQLELADFGKFVLQRSFIAVLRAEDQLRALRIFAILNDRGIDLHPVDILKANILERTNLSETQKTKFAESWEEYEETLERKRFQDLIGHMRMTYIRGRTQNPLHDDVLERVKTAKQAEDFLKDELPSFVKSFEFLQNSDDIDVRNMAEIGRRSGFKDWEAPALFITRRKSQLPSYKQVLREIASIVVLLAITKAPDGQRAGRFGRMISDFEALLSGKQTLGDLESLKISRSEWQSFESSLSTDAYSIRGLRAGLLWLEWISGDDDRSVESSEVTIEHVLPRKKGEEQFWLERFSSTDWSEHSNRLGNLLLVSGRANTKMARKPFLEKMEYIQKKGGSSWIWTQQALGQRDWSLEVIEAREKEMLDAFKKRFNFL
ncbi:DUF262 domain-containing HNH endonuclease family protein [Thioclava sp. GXIMD4216]|uniref:DUF262 domain-containing protein n=1 Tax=Thioclava sp. GXIMD4216 TaxID=3131929 RepID=UPI0030D30BC3